MKIITVMVARLINTGNYEYLRIEMGAELAEGDSATVAAEALSVLIAEVARSERLRRFPNIEERRWHDWLDEDPREK